jgi:hypothetical protein
MHAHTCDRWLGLLNHDYDVFWSANDKLMAPLAELKSVPCRFCQPAETYVVRRVVVVVCRADRKSVRALQELVIPLHDDGSEKTLRHVLIDVFGEAKIDALSRPPRVQGLEPPLHTSIAWLSLHLSSPDGFLYVVIN